MKEQGCGLACVKQNCEGRRATTRDRPYKNRCYGALKEEAGNNIGIAPTKTIAMAF